MTIHFKAAGDEAILRTLGERIARHRLDRNWTQDRLAEEAGISRPTLARLERGSSATLTNWVRVLRALDLLENLDQLVPERPPSPLKQLEAQSGERARASGRHAKRAPVKGWRWGDES